MITIYAYVSIFFPGLPVQVQILFKVKIGWIAKYNGILHSSENRNFTKKKKKKKERKEKHTKYKHTIVIKAY